MYLRVLEENGAVMVYSIKNSEIISLTDLNEEAHDKAENFLLHSGHIEGSSGGPNASRWLTSSGMDYLEQAMSLRLPLIIDSERILTYITSSVSQPRGSIKRSEIISNLKLDDTRYDSAVQILLDFELVKKAGGVSIVKIGAKETHRSEESLIVTQAGRQAVHREFRDPQSVAQPSQVFNILAPSNIQAVANAINSQIELQVEQTIAENDPEALKAVVSELLKGLVDTVRSDLTLKEQADYTETAAEIQDELNKPDPEAEVIQRWMVRLAFLDQAFSVGEKAISLSSKALPTIMMLAKITAALLSK